MITLLYLIRVVQVPAAPITSAYLLRDRDKIYGDSFCQRVTGCKSKRSSRLPESPRQNPFAERLIGSIRRECLDHVLVLSERHLRHILTRCFTYYHYTRTHLSLSKDAPAGRPVERPELAKGLLEAACGRPGWPPAPPASRPSGACSANSAGRSRSATHHVIPKVRTLLEEADSGVPTLLRPALAAAVQEIREIDAPIRAVEQQLEAAAAQALSVRQLLTIPGIGLLTATALVAAVGDVQRFPSARHFASYLGLTPRETSTGPRQRLGAISKRGDTYLRMLLIHGARSVLCRAKTRTAPPSDRLRAWAVQVERLRGHKKAAVALANKLARIAWGVWRHGKDYVPTPAV
jgi:Transposase IS116/IS110/IS902 family/Integrase core domain